MDSRQFLRVISSIESHFSDFTQVLNWIRCGRRRVRMRFDGRSTPISAANSRANVHHWAFVIRDAIIQLYVSRVAPRSRLYWTWHIRFSNSSSSSQSARGKKRKCCVTISGRCGDEIFQSLMNNKIKNINIYKKGDDAITGKNRWMPPRNTHAG